MSIYPEKRQGRLTGRLRVEVQRNKKTLVKFATSQKVAKRLEMEMKAGLHDNPEANSLASSHTNNGLKLLEDQVELLWVGQRSEKDTKRRAYKVLGKLAKVLKDEGLPDDLTAIRGKHIQKAIELSMCGPSASTWNRYMSTAAKLFGWAVDHEHIENVPKMSFRTPQRKETFFLSDDDEQKLRDKLVEHGWDDLVTVLDVQLATGCRINEVLQRSMDDLTDDGDGFYSLYLGVTKNGQERYAVLETELAERYAALLGGKMPKYDAAYKRFRKARREAGLPLTQPTHAHRHTVATRLAKSNVNAALLKDFMGHENLQTTMRYIHNDTAQKKQVVKTFIRRPSAAANIGGRG